MSELLANGKVELHCGDMLEILPTLEANSIDSVLCDPPYHLTSIVKRFGSDGAAPAKSNGATGVYKRSSAGFMGKRWDGGDVAFRAETWAHVFRVLKPGGHLLAFSGTRTYHRVACAIEDAGFDVRDMVAWVYGSGFPKSHNIDKAIDKSLGVEREVAGTHRAHDIRGNKLMRGTQGDHAVYMEYEKTVATSDAAKQWAGWGTALKPSLEPICLARKPLCGTVVENVLKHGTGGINIDACRVAEPDNAAGRWPANIVTDGSDEVLVVFPESSSGELRPEHQARGGFAHPSCYHAGSAKGGDGYWAASTGSAARFFYTAKADVDDRLGSKHPTVKPLDLLQYLARLITAPGGVILDCFAGTGTTGEAAFREGFRAVLIESEPEYQADIRRRMSLVLGGPDERRYAAIKAAGKEQSAGPLFATGK